MSDKKHGNHEHKMVLWLTADELKMLEELADMNGLPKASLLRMILRKVYREK